MITFTLDVGSVFLGLILGAFITFIAWTIGDR